MSKKIRVELTQEMWMLLSTDCIAEAIRVSSGFAESQMKPTVTTPGDDFNDRLIRAT